MKLTYEIGRISIEDLLERENWVTYSLFGMSMEAGRTIYTFVVIG